MEMTLLLRNKCEHPTETTLCLFLMEIFLLNPFPLHLENNYFFLGGAFPLGFPFPYLVFFGTNVPLDLAFCKSAR